MLSHASVLRSVPGEFEPAMVDVEDPRPGEIMVRIVAAGLCHSDDHIATGDLPVPNIPICGGHEGAGVVEKVGASTPQFAVGDHVVLTFVPSCGRCLWCAQGKQQLCDWGADALGGSRYDDLTSFRMTLDGKPCAQQIGISTFSQYTTVSVSSAYKVPKDIPLRSLCLLGCAIGTGWGTAVNAAEVRTGDTVIIMGMGGIGTAALQGAAHSGATNILLVDPAEYKRDMAKTFGATEVFDTVEDAAERGRQLTNGQGSDSTLITVGRIQPSDVAAAVESIRKGGIVAVTAMGPFEPQPVDINLGMLSMYQKTIKGVIFGNWSPFVAIPTMIRMYQSGQLKLDEMITNTYSLDNVAQGFRDMKEGNIIRGIVDFD